MVRIGKGIFVQYVMASMLVKLPNIGRMSTHVRAICREITPSLPKLRVPINSILFLTLQQVVVEPLDSLEESLLLGEPLRLVGQIASD